MSTKTSYPIFTAHEELNPITALLQAVGKLQEVGRNESGGILFNASKETLSTLANQAANCQLSIIGGLAGIGELMSLAGMQKTVSINGNDLYGLGALITDLSRAMEEIDLLKVKFKSGQSAFEDADILEGGEDGKPK
jgi:hypothetical protein